MLKSLILFCFLIVSLDHALASSKVGLIQISKSNAQVYKEPSFDAKIITNLKRGQKLYALKKKFEGLDGLGLFYKVRLKKKSYGYVLDTSVKGFRPKRVSKLSDGKSRSKKKSKIKKDKNKKQSSFQNASIPYSKSFGLTVSRLNYALKTGSGVKKSKQMFLGGRISGPGWGLSRLPLDISLMYSPSSPDFFDSLVDSHSGNILILDVGLPFELNRGPNWSVYGALSGVVSRYDFDLVDQGVSASSSKTEFGFSAGLGGGYRLGRYLVKLEGKYVKLGSDSIGAQLSLQRIF